MMKMLGFAGSALTYFCVASIVAQGVALGIVWFKGGLPAEKRLKLLGVMYGVDAETVREEMEKLDKPADSDQPGYEEILNHRLHSSLDIDLRESTVEKAVADLRNLQATLREERSRYKKLKDSFDTMLADLEGQETKVALQEVQRTLEAIQPKQAKDLVLKMLAKDEESDEDNVMRDVVTIFIAMPLDKRRKIIGEFKTPEESEKLHEILRQIRLGVPTVSLIRQTRDQLKQFDPPSYNEEQPL